MELIGAYSNPSKSADRLRSIAARCRGEQLKRRPGRERQAQTRLDEDAAERLVAAYEGGATVYELAVAFGIHRQTVSTHLDRNGVERRYRILDRDAVAEAVELYEQGWSLARLGARLGVQASTVLSAFRRAGIRTRPRLGRA